MSDEAAEVPTLNIDQLSELRGKTEAASQLLQVQLTAHLETLRRILAPRRLLGKHVRSPFREDIPGADKSFQELAEKYIQLCGRPFNLRKEFEEDPLTIEARPEAYPWEYSHQLEGDGKTVTMTSPVRWVLSYRSGYTLSQLRTALAAKKNLRVDDLRQFLINALAFGLLLVRYPEITKLLTDLRYDVRIDTCAELGDLPLVTLSSCLPSFRPDDELIRTATRFSGVPAFIELIDLDAVRTLRDPLKERIESILS